MRFILRTFLINLASLWAAMKILPGLSFTGGIKTLILGTVGLVVINSTVIPILKIMLLPLNLLTLGLFTWVVNVISLYLLITFVPGFRLTPYTFEGGVLGGVIIPSMELNVLIVAVLVSFLIGFISRFLMWLYK